MNPNGGRRDRRNWAPQWNGPPQDPFHRFPNGVDPGMYSTPDNGYGAHPPVFPPLPGFPPQGGLPDRGGPPAPYNSEGNYGPAMPPRGPVDPTAMAAAIMAAQAGFPSQIPPGIPPGLHAPFPRQDQSSMPSFGNPLMWLPRPPHSTGPINISQTRGADPDWEPPLPHESKRSRLDGDSDEAPLSADGASLSEANREPKTFKEFLATQDDSITPDVAQKSYQEYLKEIRMSKPDAFFVTNKNLEWFRELYHPRNIEARAERIRDAATVRSRKFQSDFKDADPETRWGSELIPKLEQGPEADESSPEDICRETLFFRYVPAAASRSLLLEAVSKSTSGDLPVKDIRLGDVVLIKDTYLARFLWVTYQDEKVAEKALEELQGKSLPIPLPPEEDKKSQEDAKDSEKETPKQELQQREIRFSMEPVRNREQRKRTHSLLPRLSTNPHRLRHDAEQAEKVMRHLDEVRNIPPENNPLTPELLKGLSSDAERVDSCAAYLLQVHLLCYYTGNNYADEPTGVLPCPRRPSLIQEELVQDGNAATAERIQTQWEKKVDSRMGSILGADYDRPRSGGATGVAQRKAKVDEWVASRIKHEGPQRYRCLEPPFKAFKAPEFVEKHLRSKHAEAIGQVEKEVDDEIFSDNYWKDQNHLSYNLAQSEGFRGGAGYRGFGTGPGNRGGVRRREVVRRREPRSRLQDYHDLDAPDEESKIELVQYSDI